MTNKINGIDVSECDFYNDCECDAYRHEYWEPQDNTKDMCKEHDNCYFKQLARLQEENEELYKALEEIRNIAETPIIADKNRYCNCNNNTIKVKKEKI